MARLRKMSPPMRTGEVVHVMVEAGDERPVKIWVHGHDHRYEVDWRDTDDGPVIIDLRVTSDGVPITSDDLKRINAGVLARAARRYDTPEAAEHGRELHNSLVAATADLADDPAAMIAGVCEELDSWGDPKAAEWARELRAMDPDDAKAAVATRGSGFETMRITDADVRELASRAGLIKNRGRPQLSHEFLTQVAEWARHARDYNKAIYPYVAQRAYESGWRDYKVPDDRVTAWIRRCKDAGLLERDELRRPRTPREDR
jgi:hypothetical protein